MKKPVRFHKEDIVGKKVVGIRVNATNEVIFELDDGTDFVIKGEIESLGRHAQHVARLNMKNKSTQKALEMAMQMAQVDLAPLLRVITEQDKSGE